MAHLLEHLMFKGSKNHTDIKRELSERGGDVNGSTWFDRTKGATYHIPSAAHPDCAPLEILANYLLGGGFLDSRLANRIRNQDGLSYGML